MVSMVCMCLCVRVRTCVCIYIRNPQSYLLIRKLNSLILINRAKIYIPFINFIHRICIYFFNTKLFFKKLQICMVKETQSIGRGVKQNLTPSHCSKGNHSYQFMFTSRKCFLQMYMHSLLLKLLYKWGHILYNCVSF